MPRTVRGRADANALASTEARRAPRRADLTGSARRRTPRCRRRAQAPSPPARDRAETHTFPGRGSSPRCAPRHGRTAAGSTLRPTSPADALAAGQREGWIHVSCEPSDLLVEAGRPVPGGSRGLPMAVAISNQMPRTRIQLMLPSREPTPAVGSADDARARRTPRARVFGAGGTFAT